MHVPHRTAVLPPAFSAMLPPMVQAQALVGSVAKTRPRSAACSMACSVTTPASTSMTWARTGSPAPVDQLSSRMPRMRHSFSVLMMMQPGRRGTAPPVSPVPAPRGMAKSPSSAMAASRGATSASSRGMATATGRCRRQSVASVAWATKVYGSKKTLALPMIGPSAATMRWRSAGACVTSRLMACKSPRHAPMTSPTNASPPELVSTMPRSVSRLRKKRRRRFRSSMSSWYR
jgi:hypothetical protein